MTMTTKKKILFITYADFSENEGGPGRFLGDLCRHLPQRSNWYYSFSGTAPQLMKNGISFNNNTKQSPSGIFRLIRLIVDRIPVLGPFLYILRLKAKGRRLKKSIRPNEEWIINSHDFLSAYCFCDHNTLHKLVFTNHAKGSNYEESVQYKEPYYGRSDWRLMFKHIEKKVISHAHTITFPSTGAQNLLVRDYPTHKSHITSKGMVIYTGVERKCEETWLDNRKSSTPIVLSIANHIPAKNILASIKAFKAVIDLGYTCKFINCGKAGPSTAELKDYIDSNNLQHHVELKGTVTSDEIGQLMLSASVLVMSAEITVFDLVILEAMSVGLPIITTRLEGFIEALGESYPYFADNNNEITDAIISLTQDSNQSNKVSRLLTSRHECFFKNSNMVNQYVGLVSE